MKKSIAAFLALSVMMILSLTTLAEDETSVESTATLDEFKSLVGHWRGEGLGGVCEETWLPESGGIMLGTFKLMQNEQVSFFEIMSLSIDSLGPAVRVKHFNADMTGWEDKADMVTFRYDSTSNGQIYFGGLRFMRPNEDSLVIGVRFTKNDGTKHEQLIKCARVEL